MDGISFLVIDTSNMQLTSQVLVDGISFLVIDSPFSGGTSFLVIDSPFSGAHTANMTGASGRYIVLGYP